MFATLDSDQQLITHGLYELIDLESVQAESLTCVTGSRLPSDRPGVACFQSIQVWLHLLRVLLALCALCSFVGVEPYILENK